MSDVTPYYFFGFRGQLLLTERIKLELWVVNGWQTFGEWHEARAGGYLWNWRPREWLSLVNSFYAGREAEGDPDSLRLYTDNNLQVRYYKQRELVLLRSLAFSLVADVGHEHRGNAPSGWMGGVSLAHHFEWTERWKSALRGDFFYDQTQAITPKFPVGSPYPWPDTGTFVVGGASATLDYWPSPWLLTRLEYSHREREPAVLQRPRRHHRSERVAAGRRRGRSRVRAGPRTQRRSARVERDLAALSEPRSIASRPGPRTRCPCGLRGDHAWTCMLPDGKRASVQDALRVDARWPTPRENEARGRHEPCT